MTILFVAIAIGVAAFFVGVVFYVGYITLERADDDEDNE